MPERAFLDMYRAMYNAKKFIYISGWSVDVHIKLVRNPPTDDDIDYDLTVGQLLKKKAKEGVRVLVAVWDEKMSTETRPGLMDTNDEDTKLYFKGTEVECILFKRVKYEDLLSYEWVSTAYAHHQKTICADTVINDKPSVVAFVGGLDITGGRYDCSEFPLWSTLNTIHKDDFYQSNIYGATKETGPRQPWHDCHSKVEGEIALDVMKNFEERWYRQAQHQVTQLIDAEEFRENHDIGDGLADFDWNVQLFRSITSDSCFFDLENKKSLQNKDGKLLETSVLNCMVQRVRNAKKFIYMENQYFMGSSFSWYSDRDVPCNHILPREIAQKIVEKIASNEPFKVYIVIPLYPEGDPEAVTTQEMLYWQYLTIDSMYRRVTTAIQDFNRKSEFDPEKLADPTEYLNFYCLAKQESPEECPSDQLETPRPNSIPDVIRKKCHSPIYIHSKMSIFDDEYVLIGSANINQRSLDGGRDTEIAVGGYQPAHRLISNNERARGAVHDYRLGLWSSHFGGFKEEFQNPDTKECLDLVRKISLQHWYDYTSNSSTGPKHSNVHAMPYPYNISTNSGKVMAMDPPFDFFPDTGGYVLGKRSGIIPGEVTT